MKTSHGELFVDCSFIEKADYRAPARYGRAARGWGGSRVMAVGGQYRARSREQENRRGDACASPLHVTTSATPPPHPLTERVAPFFIGWALEEPLLQP